MSTTGLEVFDTTLQKTNTWLKELMEELNTSDRQAAYNALRSTLHALRDRLTVQEVAQLGAQLPMLVRGFYYEGWDPNAKPVKERHREDFLARILQESRRNDPLDPQQIAHAVFAVLHRHVTEGEVHDVQNVLPAEIRDLWPTPAVH